VSMSRGMSMSRRRSMITDMDEMSASFAGTLRCR
jgi:hypothetical protein